MALIAHLATAQIGFHVDVNVGGPIWPSPQAIPVPGLLGRDVELNGYPLSMVHAEKLVTALEHGPTNTRWRDFADIYTSRGNTPLTPTSFAGHSSRSPPTDASP